MKKCFLLTAAMCLIARTLVLAQATVFPNGYISVQPPSLGTVPASPISINSAGDANYYVHLRSAQSSLYARTTGNTSNWGNTATFENYGTQNNFMVGVRGETRTPGWVDVNRGRTFGVMGLAGYATSGYNYGIFGRIHGKNFGAAIYGTSDESENGIYVDGKYAGFFNGNVRTTGNLIVNGSIQGNLLSKAVESHSMQAFSMQGEEELISEKIKNVNVIPYYKDAPLKVSASVNVGDTINVDPEPSLIEIQDISKLHYGLSAEQLEIIFPELVYDNGDGTKSINYTELIPLLLKSINELNAKIEALENKDVSLKSINKTSCVDNPLSSNIAAVYQNSPNPFNDASTIKVNVPQSSNSAVLIVYDLSGKQIKQYDITDKGISFVKISRSELDAGMYLYSLIVDDEIIGTKRMIVKK